MKYGQFTGITPHAFIGEHNQCEILNILQFEFNSNVR